MDLLYIPQLDEDDGTSDGSSGRYRLLKRVPEDGAVMLTDRAVTRVELATPDPLRVVVPPLVKGAARDFFVRIVITADTVPEITFAAPSGETFSFEDFNPDVLQCEIGVNVFAFTETDQGIFLVNRKTTDIVRTVTFDPCGGTLGRTALAFNLGAQYGVLPNPTKAGHVFAGWFTAVEGGVEVRASDRCKSSVTKLYAHWLAYNDPYVNAICPQRNLTFFSRGTVPWSVDESVCSSAPGSARSGAIGDSEYTTLYTTLQGKGKLSFKWKISSEPSYDKLRFLADGEEISSISGTRDWAVFTRTFTEDGPHTVEWTYEKDGSVSNGSDCGWVDDVVWEPTEN